jgi:uncharacterized membrane protein YagU involved in acid resistance
MKDDGRLNLMNLVSHHNTGLGDETQKWKHNKNNQGCQGEVFFQGLHITHVNFVLVYNFVFCILDTQFNTIC